jgi:outer membrane protein OmpA-like peptidoglycan-associated protein
MVDSEHSGYNDSMEEGEDSGILLSIADLMSGVFLFFVLLYVTVSLQLQLRVKQLEDVVAERDQLQEQIEQQRRIFIGTLQDQLQGNNINVQVNEETGDISVRDNILFDFGSATLKPEGQQFLNRFVPIYSQVVFSDDAIADQVVRVVIEGHTSSTGTYQSNMELSLLRSLSVTNYIFSEATQFPTKERLSQKILASGRGEIEADQSSDNPADRRVVFRFQFKGEIIDSSSFQEEISGNVR